MSSKIKKGFNSLVKWVKSAPKNTEKSKNKIIEFILCVLFGWCGAHRFYMNKRGTAILYLLTLGCVGIGWLGDTIVLLVAFFPNSKLAKTKLTTPLAYILSFIIFAVPACASSDSPDTSVNETTPSDAIVATVDTTAEAEETTIQTTEATVETTAETTSEATASKDDGTSKEVPSETDPPEKDPPETTVAITTKETEPSKTNPPETEPPETTQAATEAVETFIINTNTRKFHVPGCRSVDDMKEENKWEYTGTRDDVIAMNYVPCGICHP